jgi:hypothetical protein
MLRNQALRSLRNLLRYSMKQRRGQTRWNTGKSRRLIAPRSGFGSTPQLMILRILGWMALCSATLSCLAQARQNGVTCATCHAAEAASQPLTPMGRALALPGHDTMLKSHPILKVRKGRYTYTVETHGTQSTYSVTDGTETIAAPILWNFGADNQTWVLERGGEFYESLVSYYLSIDGLDTTTGDETLAPRTLEEAFGRMLTPKDTKACFGCHATNAVLDGKLQLESLHPGVGCDHCHLGANQHLADATKGNLATLPPDLSRFTP